MPTLLNEATLENACNFAAYSDPVCFSIQDSGCVINAGARPSLTFSVGESTQTDGDTFVINGITFTVDFSVTSNTATSVNVQAGLTPQEICERIVAMLLSNPIFAGKISAKIIVDPTNSEFRYIVIDWLERTKIDPFTNDFSGLTFPYSIIAETSGETLEKVPCCQLGFEIWERTSDGSDVLLLPMQTRSYPLSTEGLPTFTQIMINDYVQGQLSTRFVLQPNQFRAISRDSQMRKCFFLKYFQVNCGSGGAIGNCGSIRLAAQSSPVVTVLNAALPPDNLMGLCEYHKTTGQVKPLTMRPNWKMPIDTVDWIWLLLDHRTGAGALETYVLTTTYYDINNNEIVADDTPLPNNQSCGGVYRVPSGPANTAVVMPSNAYSYRLEIYAVSSSQLVFSQSFVITRAVKKCADAPTFYFLNDFGAYDAVTLCDAYESSIEGQKEIVCNTAICVRPIQEDATEAQSFAANTTKLGNGKERVLTSNLKRKFTGVVENLESSEAVIRYVEAMVASRSVYALFYSGQFQYLRRCYIDTNSLTVYRKGDRPRIEIDYYFDSEKATVYGGAQMATQI